MFQNILKKIKENPKIKNMDEDKKEKLGAIWNKIRNNFVVKYLMLDEVEDQLKKIARWHVLLKVITGIATGVIIGAVIGGFLGILAFVIVVVRSAMSDRISIMLLFGYGDMIEKAKEQTGILKSINDNLARIANGISDTDKVIEDAEESVSEVQDDQGSNEECCEDTAEEIAEVSDEVSDVAKIGV